MNKHDQNGAIDSLLLPLIVISLLFVSTAGFAIWAYSSRQDYKNNTDAKVATAVTVARQTESTAKDKQFAEISKQPLRAYLGPQAYGSLVVKYPKTWSAYVDDTGAGASQIDGYFHPGSVPSLTAPGSTFALRVQVLSQTYISVLAGFRGLETSKQVTISPYSLQQVPSVVGVRIDGTIKPSKNGTMIILPLRDKTIQISTEGSEFAADFATYILPNISFVP